MENDTNKTTATSVHITKVLSKKGYALKKKELTKTQIKKIRTDLTVKPFIHQDYGIQQTPYPIYLESVKKLYLPRNYGIINYGEPDINKINSGETIKVKFIRKLRKVQLPILNAYMSSTKTTKGGGIICVPCGYGKTVIALNALAKLKKKTLIIVHKGFLMNQWKERIKFFLNDVKIGKIQGKTIDIINKDIVLGMLQSISMKDYPEGTFDDFGMVIFDECHHLSAEVFSKALTKIAPKYLLGLSATPKRKDGLSKVFQWYLGDIVFSIKKRDIEDVDVRCISFNADKYTDNKDYNQILHNYRGKINMAQMINNICSYVPRTKYIIKLLKPLIKKGRKILILSDRREHLKVIKTYLDKKKYCGSGYYLGGMKQSELKKSEDKQVLLATYSMASEGFDVPTLNTLVLASPKSDVVQSVGRILRLRPEDRTFKPVILDIIDSFSVFQRQAIKRKKYYKSCSYNITMEKNIIHKKYKKNPIPKGICLIDDIE